MRSPKRFRADICLAWKSRPAVRAMCQPVRRRRQVRSAASRPFLFESSPAAVYSIDASGVIQEFNRCAAELWGRRGAVTLPVALSRQSRRSRIASASASAIGRGGGESVVSNNEEMQLR